MAGICCLLMMMMLLPPASAQTAEVMKVVNTNAGLATTAGAPGCTGGASAAFVVLPGPAHDEQRIPGCGRLTFAKTANTDAQIAVTGGENSLLCDWRPLEPVSCSGHWGDPGAAVLQVGIRGGTPGAIIVVAT